jgi:hypothetical protein
MDLRRKIGTHCKENSKQIFPEKELRGHSLNFYIHLSVSELYIPTIDLPILLQEKTHECGNRDCGRAIPRKGVHKRDIRCSAVTNMV